jgi:Ca-activated chloride channel family protein
MRVRSACPFALAVLCFAGPRAEAGVLIPDRGGAPLRLRRQAVTVEVDDQLARSGLDQVFENTTAEPVDGTYAFPLPDGAGVAGFATWIDGQRVDSVMKEKHDAEKTFEKARDEGRGASLLEIGGTNRFSTRVANVGPGQTRRLELRYDEVLRYDSGTVSYLLPLTTPGIDPQPIGDLSVDVTLRDQKEIGDVTASLPGAQVTRLGPHEVRVRFSARTFVPKSDLRIDYKVRSKDVGVRFVAHRPAGADGYFLLMFAPQELTSQSDIVNRDVVFVFDISGSMAGTKIEQARRALLLCLSNLHAGDRFDVVAFDDRVDLFQPEVVPVTAETLQSARTFVGELRDRGGTDIHQALTRALATFQAESQRPRTIIFLTDGEATSGITTTEDIVRDVAAANGTAYGAPLGPRGARIFTFGVGPSVNRELLERLGVGNGGAVEYIASNEGIDARVGAFFARIAQPVLANLSIDFGGREVKLTYPHTLPDLYKGLELVLAGRFSGVGEKSEILLKGDLNGQRKEFRAKVDFPTVETRNPFVARVWARRRVEALLGEVRLEGETPERRQEIVELAEAFNIATPYTSFVADAKKELASLTPDRVQPGDPEIEIHAPAEARSVTLVFPFGLTKDARWESRRQAWTCRFLVPRDTPDGVYDVKVAVALSDRVEWLALKYVVDTTAPLVKLQVKGRPRPGATVELVARQIITEAELRTQKGGRRGKAFINPDIKSIVATGPDGKLFSFTEDKVGRWHATYRIAADAHGPVALKLRVVDVADNAREVAMALAVPDLRLGSR